MSNSDRSSTRPACPNGAERIGLIGVGLLGSAIEERVLAANYQMILSDRNASRLEPFRHCNALIASSPSQVIETARRVILCLPDSQVVSDVLVDVSSILSTDQLLLDTTTGDPRTAEEHSQQLLRRGVHYVDATVLGSSEQMRTGHAVVMVGATPTGKHLAEDLLQSLSEQLFSVGPPGSGQAMKLVVNLALGLNRAVLAETLAFARAQQLDLSMVLDVLKSGAAYSRVMDDKGAKMMTRDFTPQARLKQHHKDVRLILKTADRLGLELPLSAKHQKLLSAAIQQGYGDSDNSAIITAWLNEE